MEKIKMFCAASLVVAAIFLMPSVGWTQPKPETNAPVIVNAFAVDKGQFGVTLKIYLEADDPDGNMLKIVTAVDQVGYGRYPADIIFLKPQYRKHFKGYIQWNTFSKNTSYLKEWNEITIRVSVVDMAGNESKDAVFPFTFESGVTNPDLAKLPPPFADGNNVKLGNVVIDLYEPTTMGAGDRSD